MNNRVKYLFVTVILACVFSCSSVLTPAQADTPTPTPSESQLETSSSGFLHRNPSVTSGVSSLFSFLFGTGEPSTSNVGGQIKAVADAVSPIKSYLEFFTNRGDKVVKGFTITPDGSIVAGGWSNPDSALSTDAPNTGYPKPVGGPNDSNRNFKIYDFYLDMMSTHTQSPPKFFIRSIIARDFYDPPDVALDRVTPDAATIPQIDAAGQQGVKYPYGPWGSTPAGTTLGILYWRGSYKTSTGVTGMAARSAQIYARNDADLTSESPAPGTLNFATAGTTGGLTDRMTIKSTGNVGIGTVQPATKLETVGTIRSSRTGTPAQFLDFAANNGTGLIRTSSGMPLELGEGSNTHVAITGSGNVGIGTTTPAAKFESAGPFRVSRTGVPSQYIDIISNGGSAVIRTPNGVPIEMGVGGNMLVLNPNGNVGIGTSNPTAKLEVNGSFKTASCTGCADVAEDYKSDEMLEAGDVVVLDTSTDEMEVVKSTSSYAATLLGVVSSAPAVRISEDGGITMSKGSNTKSESGYPVALTGRVPVKVSTQNGAIKVGDKLTSSSIPGVAMKATKKGDIIGKALQSYNGSGIGKIKVFVGTSYYSP